MMELNFKTNDIAFEVKEHVAYILQRPCRTCPSA